MTNTVQVHAFQIRDAQWQTPYKTLTHKLTNDDLLNKPRWTLHAGLQGQYLTLSGQGPAALLEADKISVETVGLPFKIALDTWMELLCRIDLWEQGHLEEPSDQLSSICDESGQLVPYNEEEHQRFLKNFYSLKDHADHYGHHGLLDLMNGLDDLFN